MSNDWFFEKFALIADAPGAVARMRGLVLDLAVQGKLVRQDPNDKPADELLEKIREARRSLVENGNLKTKVQLAPIGLDQLPYSIPKTWLWVPLNELAELVYGKLLPMTELLPNGFPVFGANGIIGRFSKYLYEHQMLLISCRGAYSGTPNISPKQCYVTNNSIVCEFFDPKACDIRFYHAVISVAPRKKIVTGSAQPQVTVTNAIKLPVPLPPLAEQKRIVAKVEELMGICDALEAQQRERESRKSVLVRASLSRFAESPTPENLGYLFHNSYDIPPSELRKSILTLAVQGKLVPQDPNDEPAMALLQQIESDKSLMVKEGKLRGSTTITPMEAQDGEFELPSSWTWVPFGQIMVNRDGERIPVSKEERETKAKTYDYYGASGVIDKIDNYLFDKPLLLIGEDGANLINRSTPIAFIARGKYWVNNHAHVLDGISEDFLRYIELHINAINLERYITGSAQPKMNQAKMNSIPIALPPLAEQRRIVAKVDKLMALVDELERQQEASREKASKLLDAIVQEMTSGGQDIAATMES